MYNKNEAIMSLGKNGKNKSYIGGDDKKFVIEVKKFIHTEFPERAKKHIIRKDAYWDIRNDMDETGIEVLMSDGGVEHINIKPLLKEPIYIAIHMLIQAEEMEGKLYDIEEAKDWFIYQGFTKKFINKNIKQIYNQIKNG